MKYPTGDSRDTHDYGAASTRTGFITSGNHCGFNYVVRHNSRWYRCGYLWLPPSHPWYRVPYQKLHFVTVHGGLTVSTVTSDEWWVIGFDCAHSRDAADPELLGKPPCEMDTDKVRVIRTTEYCVDQLKQLAEQAYVAIFLGNPSEAAI